MTLALLMALLRRSGPINIEKQVLRGHEEVRDFLFKYSEKREAGGEPPVNLPIAELDIKTATTEYQDLASYTVPTGRIGLVSRVEMACENYTYGRFKLIINNETKWEDKELPESLSLAFPELEIRAGKSIRIQGKSSDATQAPKMWGDITGKVI